MDEILKKTPTLATSSEDRIGLGSAGHHRAAELGVGDVKAHCRVAFEILRSPIISPNLYAVKMCSWSASAALAALFRGSLLMNRSCKGCRCWNFRER